MRAKDEDAAFVQASVSQTLKRHQPIPHAYADDTQIYGFCRPADSAELDEKVSICVDEASALMASNRHSAAAESRQDRGPLVLMITATTCRSHIRRSAWAALTCSQFLWSATSGSHRRWHDHQDPRLSRCQSVVNRGSTSDPERAAISVTSCLADRPWFVLWLSARWTTAIRFSLVPLPSCKMVSVRLECCHQFSFLSEAVSESHMRSGLPRFSWNSAVWEPSLDIWRRHSTSSALCWLSHAGGTVHQTLNARWPCLPSGFGICQVCAVADDVPSRAEDCSFPVVVQQWLGDRYRIAQYNCCLPSTTDCRRFCFFLV